jgi:hypothetical protein
VGQIELTKPLKKDENGTAIILNWRKPKIPDFFGAVLLRRYTYDKATILEFIGKWINISIKESKDEA